MNGEGRSRAGVARLDGLLSLSFPADPETAVLVDDALGRLTSSSPVPLHVQRDAGSITVLPEQESFPFDAASRPAQLLLPAVRDLVEALAAGPGCRVESTLRIQEYLGETVMEGVFVYEEPVGVVLKARERPARPEERPVVTEPGISVRAESFLQRYQWPLLGAAVVVAVLAYLAATSGWLSFGGGAGDALRIDAGPLEGVVVVEKVRLRQKRLRFDVRPGDEFERFEEVAEGCSLVPGVFRVLLRRKDEPAAAVVPLDLRDLVERVKDLEAGETVRVEVRYEGPGFDEVIICR